MTFVSAVRHASVRFILLTLVIDALGFGLVVPIIPPLVVKLSGLTVASASLWLGALLAMFALMQFFCSPILGGLSDRFGRRPVLLLSLSGICANYLLLAWAPSLPWLFLGRLIAGATAANASTANAYIADITPPQLRAARFGLVGAAFGIGFVVGPALGGVLGAYDLRLPFLVAAALAACNLLYGAFVLPESLPPERRRKLDWSRANPWGSAHMVFMDRTLRRLALNWCCVWFALGALPTSFVLANTLRFGWDSQLNGIALGVAGLGSAVVQGLLVRRIIPALGERRAAITGALVTMTGYFCQGIAPFPEFVFAGIALQALGSFGGAAVQAMMSASAGPDRQGETMGALSSLQGLTAILSPVVATTLFSTFTHQGSPLMFPGAPFLGSAVACLVAAWAVAGVRVSVAPSPQAIPVEAE
ncbi:MAG TPA: MFS transporter [Rhodopila sp.]|uniref:MFS transporter n=1 Tax=Rhodopila sp. TaxID=2480087 RepID=UPI002C644B9D|nr:MFS transporter [Rhodopila sp.]HVY17913.1 MFS transporter [Rhodopila sp.]